MPPSDTDRIERSIVIQAPRARVWQALSDAETFGLWFGCDLRGQRFVAGQRVFVDLLDVGFVDRAFESFTVVVGHGLLLANRWIC